MDTIPSANEIRLRIRRDLPAYAFERTPSRAGLFLVFNAIIASGIYIAANLELPWYWLLAISLILGHQYFVLGILAHDVMHGGVIENKRYRFLISYFGFYPFFISPYLWDVWHTKAHHGRTNTPRDPDGNLTLAEALSNPLARVGNHLMPSAHNRLLGLVFYCYWFTLVGQVILWANGRFKDWDFASYGFRAKRARADVAAYVIFWLAIALYVGSYVSLFVIVLPMMVGNIIFMAYASSEHVYLPQTEKNHPLENTASVRMPAIIDRLTLNFSNHVEHHLFPSMSYVHTPLVRRWLQENMKEYYMEPSMKEALRIVFNTPRLYKSADLLCFLDDQDSTVDASAIRRLLRSDKQAVVPVPVKEGG